MHIFLYAYILFIVSIDFRFSNVNGMTRGGNGAGLFGYPPRPNGMTFNFNKRVWDGFENVFKNPGWVRVSPHPIPT